MLSVPSGELGYEHVAVRNVIERAKTSRATFYKNFEDLEDCFSQAYGDAAEWLYSRVIGAARARRAGARDCAPGWPSCWRFARNQPATARALFVEVHAAGGRAMRRNAI